MSFRGGRGGRGGGRSFGGRGGRGGGGRGRGTVWCIFFCFMSFRLKNSQYINTYIINY